MKILNIAEKAKGVLNLFNISYLDKNGKKRNWEVCSRKGKEDLERELFDKICIPDAVMIVATHEDTNELVVLKEFRISINDYIYSFPAGIIEENENLFDAAKREFKEETGMDIIEFDYSRGIKPRYSSVGLTNEKVSIIDAKCKGNSDQYMKGDNEEGQIMLIDVEEAKRILKEEKVASKTELILENYIMKEMIK